MATIHFADGGRDETVPLQGLYAKLEVVRVPGIYGEHEERKKRFGERLCEGVTTYGGCAARHSVIDTVRGYRDQGEQPRGTTVTARGFSFSLFWFAGVYFSQGLTDGTPAPVSLTQRGITLSYPSSGPTPSTDPLL